MAARACGLGGGGAGGVGGGEWPVEAVVGGGEADDVVFVGKGGVGVDEESAAFEDDVRDGVFMGRATEMRLKGEHSLTAARVW